MTETPTATIVAEITDYDGLIQGLRQRIHALGTSFDVIDELLLLSPRYSAKVLSPRPSKFMSKRLFGDILSVAAVKLLLIEDPEQFDKIKHRLDQRSTLGVRIDNAVHIVRSRRHFREIGKLGSQARKRQPSRRHMRRIGKLGGRARMDALSPQMRAKLSRKGHEARWGARGGIASPGIEDTVQIPMNSA
jgi:hypothetical protein